MEDEEPDISPLPTNLDQPPKTQKLRIAKQYREVIQDAYIKKSKKDFLCFVRGLVIASMSGPQIFEKCMVDFQRNFFEDVEKPITALRDGDMPEMRRFWLERTKKASKDADLAVVLLWVLAFPVRPFYAQVGAANKEQAAIVKERMTHLLHWNPWLNDFVEIVQWEVRSKTKLSDGSPMAKMDILSADSEGSHGGTPDLLVINELSHIKKWAFAETLMDNADGVAQGVVIIATNAGVKGTKAEAWKLSNLKSENWSVHVWARPAPWHSKKTIDEAARRNPWSRYRRLWWGEWVSGSGDALNDEWLEKAFNRGIGPLLEKQPGWEYLAGLDIGVKHDHCGLVVIGVHYASQTIRLCWIKRRKPPEGGEIYLPDVEDDCFMLHKVYGLTALLYDPYEARLMAQRLRRLGVPMRELSFSVPKHLTKMAEATVQVLKEGKIQLFDDEEGSLRADFGILNIVEKSYGFRLESTSNEAGHADLGTALIITLPAAVDMLGINGILNPDDDVVDTSEGELEEEEIEAMPDELKSIYGMDEHAPIDKALPIDEQMDLWADVDDFAQID